MPADNPLFRNWSIDRFNATVINDIWPEVFFFSLIATMVATVSKLTTHTLAIPNTLLTVLGTVLGLVISFRTSSAYERYQDGRKMWSNIATISRNLSLLIWIHIPNTRENKGAQRKQSELHSVVEKKTIINLIHAFSVSVKHFLRAEQGIYYEDLYPLVSFLPRYANQQGESEDETLPLWHDPSNPIEPSSVDYDIKRGRSGHPAHSKEDTIVNDGRSDASWMRGDSRVHTPRPRREGYDPEKALALVESDRPLKPARNPPETTVYDYVPLLRFFKWSIRKILHRAKPGEARRRKVKTSEIVESQIPVEILMFLSNYSYFAMTSGLLQPSVAVAITNNITSLSDTLSNLERICNTPLPFAYQAHLRMSVWLYLLFLPFQIYSSAYGYLIIPGTAFASFLLLGFLEIGQEIENPFNYDLNDLDLDYFCQAIHRELNQITAHPNPHPSEFIFSVWNQPLAPADRRNAYELTKDESEYETPDKSSIPGMASIRRTLVKSWKDVDALTRNHH